MTEINLLPEQTAEVTALRAKVRRIRLISLSVLIAFLIVVVAVFTYWAVLVNELSTINLTYADYETKLGQLVEQEGIVRGVIHKAGQIKTIEPELLQASTLIDSLSAVSHGGVLISEVVVEEEKRVTLKGIAYGDDEMVDFINQVENMTTLGDKPIKEVVVDSLTKDSTVGYRFSITLKIQSSPKES